MEVGHGGEPTALRDRFLMYLRLGKCWVEGMFISLCLDVVLIVNMYMYVLVDVV